MQMLLTRRDIQAAPSHLQSSASTIRLIRVFPRKTKATPDDALAYFDHKKSGRRATPDLFTQADDQAQRAHYIGWWYPGGGFNGEGCFGYEGESIGWSRRHQPTHWTKPSVPIALAVRPVPQEPT